MGTNERGYDGLAARAKGRRQTWNKIPQKEKNWVGEEALEHPELSSRELAVHIVDHHKWYISASSVYRILKERGLITTPAHIVLSATELSRSMANLAIPRPKGRLNVITGR